MRIILLALLFLFTTTLGHAATQLDADYNGYLDQDKGGLNQDVSALGDGLIKNSSGTFSVVGLGTLTNNKFCTYIAGTGIVCNSDGGGDVDTTGTVNANEIPYWSDSDTLAAYTEAEFKTAYSLAIGVDVQAYDANLPTWPATVDATETGYLNGVTSAIQTQLDAKEGTLSNEAGLYAALSDVSLFLEDLTDDTSPGLGGNLDLNGHVIADTTGRNDDDCTGNQGQLWWDSTDSQWEFCNANSGTPIVVGAGSDTIGWDYTALSSAPGSPVTGKIYRADCDNWDPASQGGTTDYFVLYTGSGYVAILDIDGNLLVSSLTLGGIILGDSSPDAEGEVGYASDAFLYHDSTGQRTVATLATSQTLTNKTIDGDDNTVQDLGVGALKEESNFTSLTGNWYTTGTLQGSIAVSSQTGAHTVSAQESHGTLFVNTTAADLTLPTASAGLSLCAVQGQGNTGIITIQPNTGDYLVVDGARGTAATDYASSGAAGDKICVVAVSADDWIVTMESGTWSE